MEQYIWVIWDLIAVVVIIACVRHCAKQGLVRTIISFLAYFIAAAGARILSPIAAEFLYNLVVKDAMVLFVGRELGETLATGQDLVRQVLDSFPAVLQQYVPRLAELADAGYATMEAGELVNSLVDAVLRDPVVMILGSLCFLVVFSLILMLTRWVARLFTGIYRIPVIGTINTFLGGVVGILQAVLFLLIGALAVKLAITLTGGELVWLSEDIMDQTYIWRVFYAIIS